MLPPRVHLVHLVYTYEHTRSDHLRVLGELAVNCEVGVVVGQPVTSSRWAGVARSECSGS